MTPDPSTEELARWRSATGFQQLGALAADFIEGQLEYFPGWLAADIDEETDELVPTLAACNRAGFLTVASQPGRAPYKGFGDHVFAQRAFVAGFATSRAADAIGVLALDTELIISSYPSTDHGGCRVPVSRRGDETTAWAGQAAGPDELEIFAEVLAPQAMESLLAARYLSIIDPHWGQRDLLWESIAEALAIGTHDEPDGT
ncbi:MAG: hypothetical protein ACI8QZ_002763 [Chlamydiales bacterium]